MQAAPLLHPGSPAHRTTPAPVSDAVDPALRKAAKELEALFIGEMMNAMNAGLEPDPITGGGQGEAMWRSLMTDEYAKISSQRDGFGLSDAILRQLIQTQETSS